MKILIVSGFLGAGKTTFIRHLTDTLPQVDFAIFENEIGGTDLDAKVLRDVDRSLNVYEMTENCVCCTGKADFLTNLMTILSALDPEVLIVEPTGAARLSALMGAIEGLQYDALELLPPLTLVDAGTFFREKDDFSELRLDQIRHGSVLVLSKSEQLSPEETAVYRQELQELAPEAEIITGDYKKRSADWFRSLLEKRGGLVPAQEDHEPCQEHHHHDHDHHDHDHHHGEEALTTVTLTRVAVAHPLYQI
ncbi:GTP-binding protein, partial [Acidaminococcus fermentans]|uniref:GTP-binding protein n=1 Tax=Acidaminococcus fermentans TaxID=905 RepID=UPI0030807887